MKRALRTLALTWPLLTPDSAHADEISPSSAGRFTLEIRDCPSVPDQSVRHILSIEIGDLLVGQGEGPADAHDALTIRCAGDSAWIEASGQAGTKSFEQLLHLADFPGDAAPRALALAGLELLAAQSSAVRGRMASKANPTPVPPVTVAATRTPPAPPSTREIHVGVAATWRRFLSAPGPSTWGGQVQARSVFAGGWHLDVDADLTSGRNHASGLGDISALLLSSAASLGVHGDRGALGGGIGVGCRFGAVRLSGNSTFPSTVTGTTVWHPWGGPIVAAGASGRVGRFTLTLTGEVGHTLFEIDGRADNTPALTIGGTWLAVMLGAGFRT